MTLRITWSARDEQIDGVPLSPDSQIEHVLEFDAVTRETHGAASTLTEKGVESGAPITDHKIRQQRSLSIEGVVTNTPIGAPPPSGYGPVAITVTSSKSQAAGATVRVFSARFDRVFDVHATLDMLATEPIPVTVTTRTRIYEHAQIIRVSAPRTSDDGDSMSFAIELREIRVAESRSVDIPTPTEPRGRRQAASGEQGTTEVTEERERSMLLRATRGSLDYIERFGGSFG